MTPYFQLPSVGFGTAALTTGPHWDAAERIPEAQAIEAVRHAHERGMTYFDTAPSYGQGAVEPLLGKALHNIPRDTYTLSTKVGYTRDAEGIHYDYSYEGVMRSLDASITRLQTGDVDIVHIHDPENHPDEAISGAFNALDSLRSQGVIQAISLGMNHWQPALELLKRADFDCVMIAGRYTLLEQGALPLLDYCAAQRIHVFLAAIYNSGILAVGSANPDARYNHAPASEAIRARVAAIEAVCHQFNVPLHAAATQFPIGHPAVASIVVGFQSAAEVDACLGALEHPIPVAFWDALRHADLLDPHSPVLPVKAV